MQLCDYLSRNINIFIFCFQIPNNNLNAGGNVAQQPQKINNLSNLLAQPATQLTSQQQQILQNPEIREIIKQVIYYKLSLYDYLTVIGYQRSCLLARMTEQPVQRFYWSVFSQNATSIMSCVVRYAWGHKLQRFRLERLSY